MENSQMLHSYNSDTATAPSIGTDRLLRYLPKKQTEPRQVAIDIPETASQIVNQDASKEAGKLNHPSKLCEETCFILWFLATSNDFVCMTCFVLLYFTPRSKKMFSTRSNSNSSNKP